MTNSGKIAFVTGASRGIGRSVAIALAVDGYNIVAVARTEESLQLLAKEIRDRGQDCLTLPLDVSKPQELDRAVAAALDHWGRIDALINNAGIWFGGVLQLQDDQFTQMIDTNLRAPFHLMQLVAPIMQRQRRGHIINIASIGAKVGSTRTGGYGATKRALLGLGESFYRLLAKDGVKVTTICPSWTNTEMARQAGCPHNEAEIVQTTDITSTIRWLLDLSPAVSVPEVVLDCSKEVS